MNHVFSAIIYISAEQPILAEAASEAPAQNRVKASTRRFGIMKMQNNLLHRQFPGKQSPTRWDSARFCDINAQSAVCILRLYTPPADLPSTTISSFKLGSRAKLAPQLAPMSRTNQSG